MKNSSAVLVLLGLLCLWPAAARAFSASDFLETAAQGRSRAPGLPERITIQPSNETPEEIQKMLSGSYKASFSCDGKPLSDASRIKGHALVDGWYNNGLVLHFVPGGKLIRQSVEAQRDDGEPKMKPWTGEFACEQDLKSQPGSVVLSCASEGILMRPFMLRSARVAETGEFVLIDETFTQAMKGVCPPGESGLAVLTPVPLS